MNYDKTIDFLNRYKAIFQENGEQLWHEKELIYSNFIKRFVDERPNALKKEREIASTYNLFSILKIDFSEVRFHTPILANLLNPTGSHGQGLEFYNKFIETCLKKEHQEKFLKVTSFDLLMSSEKRKGGEQIDILLYCCNPQNRFAIIIENKIWAKDQPKQLYRYYKYAKDSLGLATENICIIYLKPNKKPPDLDNLSDKEKRELNVVLIQIEYGEHILSFLKRCSIGATKVKETIEQYILTIQALPL